MSEWNEGAPRVRRAPGLAVWLLLAAAGFTAAAVGVIFASPALLDAWQLAVTLLAGLAVGSLGLLMIGQLLGGDWLHPIRDELQPATWTLPLVALLAAPIAFGLETIYPFNDPRLYLSEARRAYFTHESLLLRGLAFFALWIGLAALVTRRGERRWASAAGLALLAPTVTLAGVDWVAARSPFWLSSLFGFGFAVSQLLAALALAFLVNLAQGEHPNPKRFRSLSSALLSLALLTIWVWFVQFLVAWEANLPEEAAWYEARLTGSGRLLFAAVPALFGAVLLLLPFDRGRWRLIAASALILAHHVTYMAWLMRPAPAAGVGWLDVAVLAGLGTLWVACLVAGVRLYDSSHPREADKRSTAQSGRPDSSYHGRSGRTSGGQTITSSAPKV